MSDRAQFVLGSVMLALAIGLLVGSVVLPPSAIGAGAEGRGFRYGLLTGVAGSTAQSETIYIIDDATEAVMVYEYNARAHELTARNAIDLRGDAAREIKKRAAKEPRE